MRARTKVVHLTSVHPAFDVRIYHKECQTLAQAGYEVVLIAPHESDELMNGIKIRAVRIPRGRAERTTRTIWSVCRAALRENACTYHFHDPELVPVGLLLKLRGKHVIYDVHEDGPRQVLNKPWIPRRLRPLVGTMARLLDGIGAWYADGVVAATPAIARRFPPRKTVVVQNFPTQDEIIDRACHPYLERAPLFIYIGGISILRGLREIVQATLLVPESLGARLLLVGKFIPPELEHDAHLMRGWENVQFLKWQPRSSVATLLSHARAGLAILHPVPNYIDSYPIKIFEYMSVGIPVVASDFPTLRQIVGSANCGLLVNPLDPKAIAAALQWLLEHPEEARAMGERGKDAVRAHYNWNTQVGKMLRFYDRLTSPK